MAFGEIFLVGYSGQSRAGKMAPSCSLGYPITSRDLVHLARSRSLPYNKAEYWPRSVFASLWTSTSSRSINTQKKNLANIQPSWPHTWSITHTYCNYILPKCDWSSCNGSTISMGPVDALSHPGLVVRKPVNVNPGLNVNCSIIFFLLKNVFHF